MATIPNLVIFANLIMMVIDYIDWLARLNRSEQKQRKEAKVEIQALKTDRIENYAKVYCDSKIYTV